MIVRVFDDNDWATYYCTLCTRPFKALHEANEHGRYCGQAVPIQPTFKSYTTAATFELKDDDAQFYTNEARTWQGLTEEEIEATWSQLWKNINQMKVASEDRPQQETVRRLFARALETKLKEKNT